MRFNLFSTMPFLLAFFVGVAFMGTSNYDIHARNIGALDVGHLGSKAVTTVDVEQPSALGAFFQRLKLRFGDERGEVAADLLVPAAGIKAQQDRAAKIVAAMKAVQTKLADSTLTADARAEANADLDKLITASNDNASDLQRSKTIQDAEKAIGLQSDANIEAARRGAESVSVKDRSEDDPKRGFKTIAEFGRAVRTLFTPGASAAELDPRLAKIAASPPSNYMQSSGSSGEGIEVPAAFRDEIFQLAFPGDDVISMLSPEPTDKGAVDIEADETTPWGASGVQAKWRSEAVQMTGTKTDQKLRTVRLQELYAFVTASDELLSDAPRLQNRLSVKSAQAIRYKASDAVINGTGAGQPLGWMKSGALVTISKEAGQAASTVLAKNVLKMFSRLIADGGKPFWLAHSTTLPEIATMTIGDQPIWTPPMSGMKEAPNGLLLGLPLKYVEHCETLGTKGDLQLVNPAGYYAAVKRGEGIQFASSIHLYFDYGLQAFRWTFRIGGQPFLSAPVDPAKGTATKSHFVVLETRA